MNDKQPREVRFVPHPDLPETYFPRVVAEGEEIRDITVEPSEKWSDDDVKVTKTLHDVRGSTAHSIRFTDAEAQELFGKLAAYLFTKGLLTVGPLDPPPTTDPEVG